jgi:hypothetical protein
MKERKRAERGYYETGESEKKVKEEIKKDNRERKTTEKEKQQRKKDNRERKTTKK